MRTSVTSQASKHRTAPLPTTAVDKIISPGMIGLSKKTTYLMEPGPVTIINANFPAVQKYVISRLGDNVIGGDNVEKPIKLKNANDWVYLTWTGYVWNVMYRSKS